MYNCNFQCQHINLGTALSQYYKGLVNFFVCPMLNQLLLTISFNIIVVVPFNSKLSYIQTMGLLSPFSTLLGWSLLFVTRLSQVHLIFSLSASRISCFSKESCGVCCCCCLFLFFLFFFFLVAVEGKIWALGILRYWDGPVSGPFSIGSPGNTVVKYELILIMPIQI